VGGGHKTEADDADIDHFRLYSMGYTDDESE
jgi:hypothetical protein